MSENTKYQEVAEKMQTDLKDLAAQGHTTFYTDMEAVERYGVSRVTIRRAFKVLEQGGYVRRTRGRGTVINPNPEKKIRFIAFMGECLVRNGIEPLLIKGVEEYLLEHDINLIICNMENQQRRALAYAERLVETAIDGVIFTPMLTNSAKNEEVAKYFLKRNIPLVAVSRHIPTLLDQVPSIVADGYKGGMLMTEHLLNLGHRRIAFFQSIAPEYCSSLRARYQGYKEALRKRGIPIDPDLQGNCPLAELPLCLRQWMAMEERPTAVFVDNDITLARFIETARALNIRIPEDLSVGGFDDIPQLAVDVPHTTVRVPHQEIGQMAAALMVEQIRRSTPRTHNLRETVVPVELIIRNSTGINPEYESEKSKVTPAAISH